MVMQKIFVSQNLNSDGITAYCTDTKTQAHYLGVETVPTFDDSMMVTVYIRDSL